MQPDGISRARREAAATTGSASASFRRLRNSARSRTSAPSSRASAHRSPRSVRPRDEIGQRLDVALRLSVARICTAATVTRRSVMDQASLEQRVEPAAGVEVVKVVASADMASPMKNCGKVDRPSAASSPGGVPARNSRRVPYRQRPWNRAAGAWPQNRSRTSGACRW